MPVRCDRPGKTVIGKADLRTDKYAIFKGGAVIDESAILDFDVIADPYIEIDISIFSNDAILPDFRPFPDLHEMPDPSAGTYLRLRGYFGCGMDSDIFGCRRLPSLSN
jgi:hypothetical protein